MELDRRGVVGVDRGEAARELDPERARAVDRGGFPADDRTGADGERVAAELVERDRTVQAAVGGGSARGARRSRQWAQVGRVHPLDGTRAHHPAQRPRPALTQDDDIDAFAAVGADPDGAPRRPGAHEQQPFRVVWKMPVAVLIASEGAE